MESPRESYLKGKSFETEDLFGQTRVERAFQVGRSEPRLEYQLVKVWIVAQRGQILIVLCADA